MVFCLQNCSDLLWEKTVLVIKKYFINSWQIAATPSLLISFVEVPFLAAHVLVETVDKRVCLTQSGQIFGRKKSFTQKLVI